MNNAENFHDFQALGFAGPTLLPRHPQTLVTCGLHQSGVSFFWDAPLHMKMVSMHACVLCSYFVTSTFIYPWFACFVLDRYR